VTLNDTGFDDFQRDSVDVTLAGGAFNNSVMLEWNTTKGDNGTGNVTVASGSDTDTASVTVGTEAFYNVTIDDTNSPITEGEELLVNGTVTNTGDEKNTTQTVELTNFNGTVQDSATFSLNPSEQGTFNFTWSTSVGDNGTGDVSVFSQKDSDTAVTVGTEAFYDVTM